MVAHIVLFHPRGSLSKEERSALIDAFGRALREIPSIRRSRVGRRVSHGRGYEQLMTEDYEYAAVLEFDDVDGLMAYLQHPVHANLGERFFASFESALMYDYEMVEGGTAISSLA